MVKEGMFGKDEKGICNRRWWISEKGAMNLQGWNFSINIKAHMIFSLLYCLKIMSGYVASVFDG